MIKKNTIVVSRTTGNVIEVEWPVSQNDLAILKRAFASDSPPGSLLLPDGGHHVFWRGLRTYHEEQGRYYSKQSYQFAGGTSVATWYTHAYLKRIAAMWKKTGYKDAERGGLGAHINRLAISSRRDRVSGAEGARSRPKL